MVNAGIGLPENSRADMALSSSAEEFNMLTG
jgi:hypothetical protein